MKNAFNIKQAQPLDGFNGRGPSWISQTESCEKDQVNHDV